MLVNAKIEEAGLYFNGHYNRYWVRIVLRTRGGGASIEFPVEKAREFMSMFDDELDLENGVFLEQMKGIPILLQTEGNEFGKIVAVGNILSNEDELMSLEG